MKKLVFLLFPIIGFSQTASLTIKGNIVGLKDSTLVFLNDAQGNAIAQEYASTGKFTLKGKLDNIGYHQLSFIGKSEVVELYIGNENITVTGSVKSLKKSLVLGSSSHKDYSGFINAFIPLNEKISKLYNQANAMAPGPKKDTLSKQFEASKVSMKKLVVNFLKMKPTSAVSSFVLLQFYPLLGNEKVLEAEYKKLSGNAKKGLFATLIEQKIAVAKIPKVGDIGSEAPDFSQPDSSGKMISLSSFRGKYVLIDFWASWCRPCRLENPNLVAAYNLYKDKNFTIFGVSTDLEEQKGEWLQAVSNDNLTWPQVIDISPQTKAAQIYQVNTIPKNYLVDPTGKIIAKDLRGEQLSAKLKEIFK